MGQGQQGGEDMGLVTRLRWLSIRRHSKAEWLSTTTVLFAHDSAVGAGVSWLPLLLVFVTVTPVR